MRPGEKQRTINLKRVLNWARNIQLVYMQLLWIWICIETTIRYAILSHIR